MFPPFHASLCSYSKFIIMFCCSCIPLSFPPPPPPPPPSLYSYSPYLSRGVVMFKQQGRATPGPTAAAAVAVAGASAEAEIAAPSLALLARTASRQRSGNDRRSASVAAGTTAGDRTERESRTDSGGGNSSSAGPGNSSPFSAAPHQNR